MKKTILFAMLLIAISIFSLGCIQEKKSDTNAISASTNNTPAFDCSKCLSSEKCVGSACVKKTCADFGGSECGRNGNCSNPKINSSDTNMCCVGTCTIDPCFEIDCPNNTKCEKGECVLLNCKEDLNGVICPQGSSCTTSIINTEGSFPCCTQVCMEVK
ncbi:MAG: hypothetical protein AABX51_08400 [Nanoarchaeota archaeon]